jgi:hypothetical protein
MPLGYFSPLQMHQQCSGVAAKNIYLQQQSTAND